MEPDQIPVRKTANGQEGAGSSLVAGYFEGRLQMDWRNAAEVEDSRMTSECRGTGGGGAEPRRKDDSAPHILQLQTASAEHRTFKMCWCLSEGSARPS